MKRPLYVVGMTFALALLAATIVGYHAAWITAVLCGVLFLAALAVRTLRQNEGIMAALLAAGVAFALFASWDYGTVQPLQKMSGETVHLTVWVEEDVKKTDDMVVFLARVREGDLPKDTRVMIFARNNASALRLYDRVTATVTLDAIDSWRDENVFLSAWINEYETVPSDERPWNYPFIQWREHLIDRLETRAAGDSVAVLRAVCFGDKSELCDEVKDSFAAAGLSHVTAVSGFHMSVISLALFRFLCFLGVRKRWAALVSLPMPALFAVLTGFAASAMRAGVMCTVLLVGALFSRAADARNSLGAALLILLVFDPAGIYDLGLQLSAAATWGLLLAASLQSREKTGVWYSVARGVQLTVAAVVATLPLSALYFGNTSLLAPLTNLIAQPLAAVAVGAGCFGTALLCVPWLSFLGAPLVLVAGLSAKGILLIGQAAVAWPLAFMPLNKPYLVVWALAVPFALLLGWQLLKRRGVRIAAVLLAVALLLSSAAHYFGMRNVTTVTACHTGTGTVVIVKRDGHCAAVAAGSAANDTIASLLARHGIAKLDALLFVREGKSAYIADVTVKDLQPCTTDMWTATARNLTLWEDTTLLVEEGWCRLAVNERAVLMAPRGGDVTDLLPQYRTADVAIFDRVPPKEVETLALAEAILSCDDEHLPEVTQSLVWGVYPVEIANENDVTIMLR